MFNIFLHILALAIDVTGLCCAMGMVVDEIKERKKHNDRD